MSELPLPAKHRWQPLRTGLVDLFHYDHEEFRFHDGRLLLRGNNGTGKSKVMALTLPFLLDGRTNPARVEPDGDSSKRMEWNLLMGEGGDRLGYTWIEFGRLGDDGPEYRTLGCGLKAVAQRRLQSWFFITPQRVGEDLFLVHDSRTLTRDRLIQALANRGQLHDQAQTYRRAVDEQLFQLGTERYEALLDLLLQLRQPQLSKRPDESRLSNALTEALPPLEQGVIADVAEAYRNLDAEADQTRGLEEAHQAVSEFLSHYRQYAAIATRRRAAQVRQVHSRYEEVRAQLGHQREALAKAQGEQERLEQQEHQLQTDEQAAQQQRQTLRDSPAMRSAQDLHNAEKAAAEQRRHADDRNEYRLKAEDRLLQIQERHEQQTRTARKAREEVIHCLDTLAQSADQAGIGGPHAHKMQQLGLPEAATTEPDEARDQLHAIQARRREGLELLRQSNQNLTQAEERMERARDDWQREQNLQDLGEQALQEARQASERAAMDLTAGWRHHLDGLTELRLEDTEATQAVLEDWLASLEGPNPAEVALDARRTRCQNALSEQRAEHRARQQALREAQQQLEAEREALQTGQEIAPPPPHTRDEARRETRPGAPLWKLIDFHDAVSPASRAGLEAALEAAGLLDGWVMPDGQLLDADTWDTLLTTQAPCPERNLTLVFTPAVDWPQGEHPVSASQVQALLERIGLDESAQQSCWISAHGHWQLGPARGAWAKAEARYIGHAAREAARRARLAQIEGELATCRASLLACAQALEALDARQTRIEQEWQERPSDAHLRDAYAHEASALLSLEAQTEQTEKARLALEVRQSEAGQCRQRRDELAADLSLPTASDALTAIDQALTAYAIGCRDLKPALHGDRREQQRLGELELELGDARQEAVKAVEQQQEAQRRARDAETHRDTLRETIGADVEALEQRLTQVEQHLKSLEKQREALRQEVNQISKQIGGLETGIGNDEQRLEELGEQRQQAIARLRELATAGLIPMGTTDQVSVEEDASWSAEPSVQLSRRLEQALSDIDDSETAWQRHQKGLHQHFATLQAALGRHGHDAHAEQHDDLLLIRIIFQGRHQGPDELAGELAREIERRRELLTARERELVENYLIDEVASHLQDRLMETERQVLRINEELAGRPTSTGMRLRLQWRPLAEGETSAGLTTPAGLEVTRNRLLRQSMDAWSAQDRHAVGDFIQARIREARENDDAGALQDVLERALDYRYWHRFTVERWQNNRWRPAYGPASGGERALVITLPLFAAAASHYSSAQAAAPRLIMLDEVFAGVDDDARAKSMGLLAQFDLDAMMTSEREWGCYPEIPGLAIAQLIRREGVDAVFVSRWCWDGAHRIREASPDIPLERDATMVDEDGAPMNESLF
ncbi:MAG: TIGR02680 family protein [Chromatiaceae bacterium]|nr:MAG: TIGR02680 family protein [Chromatiaceae bacterium]